MATQSKAADILNGNPITTAVLVAGGLFGVNMLVKSIKKGAPARDKQKNLLDLVNNINQNGLTITDSVAENIANNLYDSMKGTGTDVNTIRRVLLDEKRTNDDVKLIALKFGTKNYGTFGEPMFSFMPSEPLNLHEWIKKELSGSILSEIITLFRSSGFDM